MVMVNRVPLLLLLSVGCIRGSSEYDVGLYGAGAELDAVLPAPEDLSGLVEYARFRLWGTNLGHGLSGLYGDLPRMDGTSFTVAYGSFGYPQDPGYDRNSSFVNPGPPISGSEDFCVSRVQTRGYLGISEYVDVGDHILLTGNTGELVRMERDPAYHPHPAGESWYVSYGVGLQPVLENHESHPANWRSNGDFLMSFPGTIVPEDSTHGPVPYPLEGAPVAFPPDIEDLEIRGSEVRAPQHPWMGPDDDVRFEGPWTRDMEVTWEPSANADPLTLTIRYLGEGDEGACGCSADCGDGFHCELEPNGIKGSCIGDDGANWLILGEVTCTVVDDGSFTFTSDHLATLNSYVNGHHAVLLASRMTETTTDISDILSSNGKRVPAAPVRIRVIDTIVTRLDSPFQAGGGEQ